MTQEITIDETTVLIPGRYTILDGELRQIKDEQPPGSYTAEERVERLERKLEHLERALFLLEMKQPKDNYFVPIPYVPISPVYPWYYYTSGTGTGDVWPDPSSTVCETTQ